ITLWRLISAGFSITQSAVFFLSKRQVLHIQPGLPVFWLSCTSPHVSFRAVTRITFSPLFQRVTSPQHLSQSRWAYIGLVNHTRCLNLNVLSVKAPTGHTSIMLPLKSLSIAFSI